jgi:HAD superfamily hydrolase (TIGR01509 family)
MNHWPEAVIFDCDGVLVDSEMISLARTRSTLGRFGLELGEAEVRDRFLGISAQSIKRIAELELGAPLPTDFQSQLTREILTDFERGLKGVEGISETIARLQTRVCVASSSSLERIEASLRIVGYADLFGPNVFSAAEVASGKPEPDIFLHAARRLGADPGKCLVVEDSAPGVTAARRANMTVFGFTGGAHAKGRDYSAGLMAAGAVLVFDDMRELPALIETAAARSPHGQER